MVSFVIQCMYHITLQLEYNCNSGAALTYVNLIIGQEHQLKHAMQGLPPTSIGAAGCALFVFTTANAIQYTRPLHAIQLVCN